MNRVRAKRSPTRQSWRSMWERCTRPAHPAFDDYGGRGIAVCERWRSFEAFVADMGERPTGKTIDRVDNDGNYEPGNCRWATSTQQNRNKRTNRILTIDGCALTLVEWSERSGIGLTTIRERIRRGWDERAAVFSPLSADEHVVQTTAIRELAATGLTRNRVAARLGVSRSTVDVALVGVGNPIPRDSVKPWAKLTLDQVHEIRARYVSGGVSQRALAAEFGVSQATLGRIVRKERWSWAA